MALKNLRLLALGALCIVCAACGPNLGSFASPEDEAAHADFRRLKDSAQEFTEARFEDGVPVFLSLRTIAPGQNPVEQALSFLTEYAARFRPPISALRTERRPFEESATHYTCEPPSG